MQCGLDHIAHENPPRYILFTDADIAYDKGMAKRLAAHAEAGGYDLASPHGARCAQRVMPSNG